MNALQSIAQLTNRNEEEIKSFDVWEYVLLVRFNTGSPRFVSFKKFAGLLAAAPKPLKLTVPASRKGSKPWVAAIKGTSKTYGLKREFLDGDIEWNGRKGAVRGKFTITICGLYQCGTAGRSDDYFVVEAVGGALEFRDISWQEAKDIARSYDVASELLTA